ncbi:2-dehydropantoate 2-reductase [Burkholderia sp. Bp9017]|uniref:2-dehydropantoate 2-reductase n=2 Tax=Burkholderia TaxID=32008 RepID=A0A7T6VDP5_9BURK|nr:MULTISPECIES: 2-dehydropantoate 2-reductase [Burkholderia]MBY4865854.1 2-dehydropantoate 2-reductase [Burkholderia anthina]QQK02003.1 2-dehydropantoate 2-reductase [Burkholderia anthina]RQZ28362.1 2-dehydropantoate 2-reductase [Burkholderia sp. Bp9017]RQZ34989.1 2-dehydropantoate 2-reductase [Burkholderia sp. Bp9016]
MSDASAASVCVFGAGAIGCYLGGRLAATGADVTFVGRARIAEAIRAQGLTLTDQRGYRAQLVPADIAFSTDPAVAAAARLVLVAVKSAVTQEAAAQLAGVLRPGTVVISFQNGLHNADVLRDALPQATVLTGMVPFNVIERGPGAFHQGSAGVLAADASPALQPFADAFARAGLPLALHRDMRAVQWAKLLLNLNNAVNALANLPLHDELSQRAYRRCLALAQREALHWLAHAAIRPARLTPLPSAWLPAVLGLPDPVFRALCGRMLAIDPLARSSMSDDLAARRATEVEWINGEIVRLAARFGAQAPVNARLCALVHAAEAAAARPAWHGEALWAELSAHAPHMSTRRAA